LMTLLSSATLPLVSGETWHAAPAWSISSAVARQTTNRRRFCAPLRRIPCATGHDGRGNLQYLGEQKK
jgi:hypothetical protein